MQRDEMILISVDDHIIEPPDLFVKTLPARFGDAIPRVARYANGEERWILDGKVFASTAPAAVSGRVREELGFEPMRFAEVRRGVWDVDARIDDMNANGVLASLNFPTLPGFAGERFVAGDDKQLMLALVEAYNDWHCDHWAGAHPGRFIPSAILPLWDAERCSAEVLRIARKDVRVVCFPENPTSFGLPSIHSGHWDRLFETLADLDLAVAMHIGTGPLYAPTPESPCDVQNTLLNVKIVEAVSDLTFWPLLRRLPSLRIAMSEGCIGWVPFLCERADAAYRNHRFWTHQDLGDLLPSDLIRRHFLFCFHEDDFGLRQRHEIGVDRIAWECDYPHADSTWPHSAERLWQAVAELPDDEIDRITHANAMRFFRFDPFERIDRSAATVGALRARAGHVDVRPRSLGGRAPARSGSVVSSREVAQLVLDAAEGLGEPVALL